MGTPPIPHRTSRAEIASGLEIITGNVSVSVITSRWSSLEVSHSATSPPNALATALATSGSPVVKRHVDRLAGRPLTIFPERTRPTTSSGNVIRFLGAALGSVSKMRIFTVAPSPIRGRLPRLLLLLPECRATRRSARPWVLPRETPPHAPALPPLHGRETGPRQTEPADAPQPLQHAPGHT